MIRAKGTDCPVLTLELVGQCSLSFFDFFILKKFLSFFGFFHRVGGRGVSFNKMQFVFHLNYSDVYLIQAYCTRTIVIIQYNLYFNFAGRYN